MQSPKADFKTAIDQIAFDTEHRKRMNYALNQANEAFERGKKQFINLTATKKIAKNRKWEALENLDYYLEKFEQQFSHNGGQVIWAEDAQQALDAILTICKDNNAQSVVKSKSIVTEEIHLNQFLSQHHIDVIETDLGEFIQQLAGEPPYHIVSPSLHKSKEDVADLFHEKLHVPAHLTPENLTLVARELLRKKFATADIGITGINFVIADIGAIAVTENEGNAWLSASCPKIHIAITGIEKILPLVDDLHLFWPLLATHGSGQRITVYNSIYTGPRNESELDGPEQMYVILLDNRRSTLLADPIARESLYCIRCGACLNVCPVYKTIGGHAYGTTYSGPIGAVITPYLKEEPSFFHLSKASTLCGACTDICPVKIDLQQLLVYNRHRSFNKTAYPLEKLGWQIWKQLHKHRFLLNLPSRSTKQFLSKKLFYNTPHNTLPVFAKKTFNQLINTAPRKTI